MGKPSTAQIRFLMELSEPNGNPENEWYYPSGKRRTGRCLVAMGLAKHHADGGFGRDGWSITASGRAFLDRIGFKCKSSDSSA